MESLATLTGSPAASPAGTTSELPDCTPGRHPGALADNLELGHGVRPLKIGSYKHRRMPKVFQPIPEFPCKRCLAGTLEACQHDDCRRVFGEIKGAVYIGPQYFGQLIINDRYYLLRRV